MTTHQFGLLDTSVVIDPPTNLDSLVVSVGISAVTVGELAFGLHLTDPAKAAEREARYRAILSAYDPIPYDAAAAHWFGAFAAMARTAGRNPRRRTSDLMIAATARHVGAALLTRNPADFADIAELVPIVAV